MVVIDLTLDIAAPLERCFDLARDIDLHQSSVQHTRERAVDGVTSGLIGMGESVTWEARHFGIRWRMTSRITAFDAPRYFQDTMVAGPFRSFQHDHFFDPVGKGTRMRDVVRFQSPFGLLGRVVDRVILRRHLERLLVGRATYLRDAAKN